MTRRAVIYNVPTRRRASFFFNDNEEHQQQHQHQHQHQQRDARAKLAVEYLRHDLCSSPLFCKGGGGSRANEGFCDWIHVVVVEKVVSGHFAATYLFRNPRASSRYPVSLPRSLLRCVSEVRRRILPEILRRTKEGLFPRYAHTWNNHPPRRCSERNLPRQSLSAVSVRVVVVVARQRG